MALGILCLETYYSQYVDDRSTVAGLLATLESNVGGLLADHRHTPDRRDFAGYIEGAWPWDRYDVLYIAAHGSAGAVIDEDGQSITLRWLSSRMSNRCGDRVVILSGCRTADITPAAANRFLGETKAAALVGYTKDVDWVQAAQMDLLVLSALADPGPGATGIWEQSPEETLTGVEESHGPFIDDLGWRFFAGRADSGKPRRKIPDGLQAALDGLVEAAEDPTLPEDQRVKLLRSVGELGIWDKRVAAIARNRKEARRVRRAAAAAVSQMESAEARVAIRRLQERIRTDDDPDKSTLLRALKAS